MNRQKTFMAFLAIGLTLAWVTTAVAGISYDFESDTAAVAVTDDADPAAPMIAQEYKSNHVQVRSGNLGQSFVPASAAQGSNFLKIARDEVGSPVEDPNVGMEAFLDLGGATTTGIVRTEFKVYVPTLGVDGVSTPAQMMGAGFCGDYTDAYGTRVLSLLTVDNSGAHNVMYWSGSALVDTGATYTPDTWQQWVVESDLDAGTTTVTVDGGASGAMTSVGSSASYFQWTTQMGNAAFAIDDINSYVVPEPGTFALLITGLLGLAAYAWRKRK